MESWNFVLLNKAAVARHQNTVQARTYLKKCNLTGTVSGINNAIGRRPNREDVIVTATKRTGPVPLEFIQQPIEHHQLLRYIASCWESSSVVFGELGCYFDISSEIRKFFLVIKWNFEYQFLTSSLVRHYAKTYFKQELSNFQLQSGPNLITSALHVTHSIRLPICP